ncbi:MAG: glycosyltransferase family 9 protein, partial [bacterium]
AAALARGHRYLGNDSGISHLAGIVGARGIAVFGDTDPAIWHPPDSIRVLHAPIVCAACGPGRLCTHRVPVESVVNALGVP